MEKIYQYGMGRSGTTLIYQILRMLFKEASIIKTHQFVETSDPVVATYRDFRDVLVSSWRVDLSKGLRPYQVNLDQNAQHPATTLLSQMLKLLSRIARTRKSHGSSHRITEPELKKYIEKTLSSIRILDKYKTYYRDKDNVLWLQYEKFFNDFGYIFDELETFFDVTITQDVRFLIEEECSLDRNRERAARHEHFGQYDPETHIHGDHIHKGAVGGWKDMIPTNLHDLINRRLENHLEEWGYKIHRSGEDQRN